MSGVIDTLTKRRALHYSYGTCGSHHLDCRECGGAWPCDESVALDAVLASLNKTTEHLEAIASYWESCPGVVMEHAGAALALLAPNHNNTQDDA